MYFDISLNNPSLFCSFTTICTLPLRLFKGSEAFGIGNIIKNVTVITGMELLNVKAAIQGIVFAFNNFPESGATDHQMSFVLNASLHFVAILHFWLQNLNNWLPNINQQTKKHI